MCTIFFKNFYQKTNQRESTKDYSTNDKKN